MFGTLFSASDGIDDSAPREACLSRLLACRLDRCRPADPRELLSEVSDTGALIRTLARATADGPRACAGPASTGDAPDQLGDLLADRMASPASMSLAACDDAVPEPGCSVTTALCAPLCHRLSLGGTNNALVTSRSVGVSVLDDPISRSPERMRTKPRRLQALSSRGGGLPSVTWTPPAGSLREAIMAERGHDAFSRCCSLSSDVWCAMDRVSEVRSKFGPTVGVYILNGGQEARARGGG